MKMERREVLDKRELNEQVQGLPLLLAHVFSLKRCLYCLCVCMFFLSLEYLRVRGCRWKAARGPRCQQAVRIRIHGFTQLIQLFGRHT
jgi:hypothetical protein